METLLPIAARAGALLKARGETIAIAESSAGGHDHGAMAGMGASTDSARPVSLTPDQARRIGVTFAPVVAGVLPREVRTCGAGKSPRSLGGGGGPAEGGELQGDGRRRAP